MGNTGLFSAMMNSLSVERKPEYAFKAIAKHVGCNYLEVLHAFSVTEFSKSRRCESLESAYFKRYEQSVCSDWRMKFGDEKEKRKKSVQKKLKAMRAALQSVRKLIVQMKLISKNSSDFVWEEFLIEEIPTILQLRNLEIKLKSEIDYYKKLPKPDTISPKTIPTAELVSTRMAILFQALNKPITDSSHDSEKLTGDFSKALKFAFRWFHIEASPKTYARKIVKGNL